MESLLFSQRHFAKNSPTFFTIVTYFKPLPPFVLLFILLSTVLTPSLIVLDLTLRDNAGAINARAFTARTKKHVL